MGNATRGAQAVISTNTIHAQDASVADIHHFLRSVPDFCQSPPLSLKILSVTETNTSLPLSYRPALPPGRAEQKSHRRPRHPCLFHINSRGRRYLSQPSIPQLLFQVFGLILLTISSLVDNRLTTSGGDILAKMGARSLISLGFVLIPVAATISVLLGLQAYRESKGLNPNPFVSTSNKITSKTYCQEAFGVTPFTNGQEYTL